MKEEYFDNKVFNVAGINKERLHYALSWFFGEEKHRKTVTHYYSDEQHFVLCWIEIDKVTSAFPAPLELDAVVEVVWAWVNNVAKHEDGDWSGDVGRKYGWNVYVEDWGHVDGHSQALCGIRPFTGWVGK